VFHSRLPGLDWQNDFYAREWDRTSQSKSLIEPQQFMRTRGNKVEHLVRPFLKRPSRVLDIGCGYGDQLFFFMDGGHELVGVEPSRHRAEFARQVIRGQILNCPVESEALHKHLHDREGYFDLIYLNQVLEHLHNPVAALRVLRSLLADDGILLIGVPDLFSESMMNFACSIIHTHSFSANALRNILGVCGYRLRADVSFPGYHYVIFEKAPASAPQHDALTGKVVRYACAHFDLLKLRQRRDTILSIVSRYTGLTETGLRLLSLPGAGGMKRLGRLLHHGDCEGLREFFPITIVMPFEKPTIWQK
jgi:SAM-dependent methyltransferase